MNNFKIYKNLAMIALTIELLASFFLFARIKNLLAEHNIQSNDETILYLFILTITLTVVLFIIILILSSKNKDSDIDEKNMFSDLEKENENLLEDENDELIDIDSYIKKIIPKEGSKLNVEKYTEKLLSNFAKEFDIVQGLYFGKDKESDTFKNISKYAYFGEEEPKDFKLGETLSGQAAKNKKVLNIKDIPENYITILSGLGSSSPNNLLIMPIIFNNETVGIVELASFKEFEPKYKDLFEKISMLLGETLSKY